MISDRILKARMAEVGRIKIGGLDEQIKKSGDKEWQMPKKFEHFVITGMDRDKTNNFVRDESIHAIIGQTPRELKIRLLYNDIDLNFRTELALYQGKTCVCRGNGEAAQRLDTQTGELIEVSCPCAKLEQEKNGCKPHGTLQCLLEQASLCGGVHKFATTGWNTISSITSSLKFIQACTGGKIAGLPLTLKYFKKATTKKDGKATTIPIVTVVYEGNPVQMLESAIKTERQRLEAGIQLETLEVQVRREMKNAEITAPLLDEEEIPEFHPEVEDEEDVAPPAKTIGQAIASAVATESTQQTEAKTEPAKAETTKKTTKTSAAETKPAEPKTKNAPAETKTAPTETVTPKKSGYCKDCKRVFEAVSLTVVCQCGSQEIVESANPESAKKAATAGMPETQTKTTPAPAATTPATTTQPSAIPPRADLQREITSLRAKLRILTADWQSMVSDLGIKDLNAASWSDETMFKVLQTLRAKGA